MNSFALLQEEVEDDGANVSQITDLTAKQTISDGTSTATQPITSGDGANASPDDDTTKDTTNEEGKDSKDGDKQPKERTLTLEEYLAQKAALSSSMTALKTKSTSARKANDGQDGFAKMKSLKKKDEIIEKGMTEDINMSGVTVRKDSNQNDSNKVLKDSTHATVARNAEIQKFFQKSPNDNNNNNSMRERGGSNYHHHRSSNSSYRGRGGSNYSRGAGSNNHVHRSNPRPYHNNNSYDRSDSGSGGNYERSSSGRGGYSRGGHHHHNNNHQFHNAGSFSSSDRSFNRNDSSNTNNSENVNKPDTPAASIPNGEANGTMDEGSQDTGNVDNNINNDNKPAEVNGANFSSSDRPPSRGGYERGGRGRGRGRGRGGYDRGGRGYGRERGRGRGGYRGGYHDHRSMKNNVVVAPNVDDMSAFPSLG